VADHAKAVISVIDVGPALNECLCGGLGIVKFSSVDQSAHGIGCVVDRGVAVFAEVRVVVRQMICRLGSGNCAALFSRGTFGRFVRGKATLLVLLAATTGAAICPECRGVLHVANYPRKPRGRPVALDADHDRRFSFCCAVDGCRDRATPASLRFLGRKVYLAVIVTLVSAMRDGLTERRFGKLTAASNVDRRTVARWRTWWLARFTATPFWRAVSSVIMPPVDAARLPAALLERFAGDAAQQLIAFLSFLGPITGGASMQTF
jgi:hypothetical protein